MRTGLNSVELEQLNNSAPREMERESLLDEELNGFQHTAKSPRSHPLLFDESLQRKPSVVIDDPAAVSRTVTRILEQWALSSPDIIVAFVSGTRSFTAWKNEDHRAALQKGIIKLLNATETWILDSGLDYGISRLIGNAVRNELQFRQSKREYEVYVRGYLKKRRHAILLMGVVPMSLLRGSDDETDGHDNDAAEDHPEKCDVNPSHTHFIFVKEPKQEVATAMRSQIIVELAAQVSRRRNPTFVREVQNTGVDEVSYQKGTVCHEQVPLIAVLIQGGMRALDMVHDYLKSDVPVLVIKGTGFLADILAFAYEEHKERGNNRSAMDIIRRDVSKRVARSFPGSKKDEDLTLMRNRIIDCVILGSQKEKELISVVESSEDLVDLDNYFLPAVFAARSRATNILKEQVRSDFLLTMKLNKPGIADSKILGRDEEQIFQVDNDLFEKALMWKGREKFVERFMEEDFALHRFLSHSRLLNLFRHAEDNDFFVNVVWHQVPRRYFEHTIEETFVTKDLNRIIEKLSGFSNFLSMHDLSSNYLGMFVTDEYDAERKAMNALMVWAVLMGRFQLAKTLWKFCEDPIPMALFVSALARGLAQHSRSTDTSVADRVSAQGREFSTMAIDVLDMSYKESNARTFDLLNQKFPDFNDRTPIKAAYISRNKYFLAHEACQIWLNRLWEGGLEITDSWNSRIPEEFKLVVSALLVFPIYFWIRYPAKNFVKDFSWVEHDKVDSGSINETTRLGYENVGQRDKNDLFHIDSLFDREGVDNTERKLKVLAELEGKNKSTRFRHSLKHAAPEAPASSSGSNLFINRNLPLWKKVYYLWSAPRTKFWIFQLFYWIYLAVFSVVVILPTCNDLGLDVIILIWTLFNVLEIALRTVYQIHHGFPVSLFRRGVEITFITGFVLLVAIFKTYFNFIRPLYTRSLMAFGLLYMYYRMVSVFFPMNSILGPMVYRIKRMITVDFLSFVRLALPFIVANMFVLQSVMYPDLPFSIETWRKGFYRAFFTLFIAFLGEIEYTPRCEAVRLRNETANKCWIGDYENYTCPTLGVMTYLLNIQYWIIMRLILVVLLNALFAATMIKVKEDSEFIYRYQRYRTVLDFASRSALPPPFSFLSYSFDWVIVCCVKTQGLGKQKEKILVGPRTVKLLENHAPAKRSYESYSYWMGLTKEYYRRKEREERAKNIAQDQVSRIKGLADDQKAIRGSLARLSDKLKQLEKASLVYFEEIKHNMSRKGHAKEGTLNQLSRLSPYPGTGIKRFLIPDHKVSWDTELSDYKPPSYCRDTYDFPVAERHYVDPEFTSRPRKDPAFWCWNATAVVGGKKIDRRTVAPPTDTEAGQVQYALDHRGLPRNIVGRTGLADRGNLCMYGPNLCVQVVLTRFRDDALRFLVAKTSTYPNLPSLFPSSKTLGFRNRFHAAWQLVESLFALPDGPVKDLAPPEDEEHMHKLMGAVIFPGSPDDGAKFLAVQQVYAGYLDHVDNTDNAWMETVVWHVDISTGEGLPRVADENFTWKERSHIKRMRPFEDHIIQHVTISKVVDD
ncbi:putative Transient receptor potential cation channel subfamily M member 7 [Hypsibius exemplaris]|uniref:Transient receptor potential cation channel subfamily M member 7 n=1 Tax=Hypsibius exemplaris TaxID=2072580 RepID=A0A1W0W979_HYPEX|nr:putative Transient receptor potential cation channel subfamily M member 7 [Hypsibius exemplaris]